MKIRAAAAPLTAAALLTSLLLSGCGVFRTVSVPIPTIAQPAACASPVDTLLVFLPGAYARPEEFIEHGFVRAVRARGIAADVVLVDAHLGYYADKSIVDRLLADVIEPARARGIQHVWLAGISVGAFGSFLTAEARPARIDGVFALGPYLGGRRGWNEVAAAGGLARWQAPTGLQPDDVDAVVWRWLQGRIAPSDGATALYVGYGLDDRFVEADRLLAAALPPGHVFTTEGGHDWPPWQRLWARMLDAAALPRDAACRATAALPG